MHKFCKTAAEIAVLKSRVAELDAALIFHMSPADVDTMYRLKSELKLQIQLYEARQIDAASGVLRLNNRDGV